MSEMTDQEFAEWGVQEDTLRKQAMADVRSEADLRRVQADCKARRKAAALSRSEATRAVVVGQRIKRGESLSFAMRRS